MLDDTEDIDCVNWQAIVRNLLCTEFRKRNWMICAAALARETAPGPAFEIACFLGPKRPLALLDEHMVRTKLKQPCGPVDTVLDHAAANRRLMLLKLHAVAFELRRMHT